jgi:formylmethanofuran dehydrogenase subunit A
MFEKLNPDAKAQSTLLKSLSREYTLDEIAILTRAGPARSLGLIDRGHLGVGAAGDITVYRDNPNREEMFATPELVFKNGELVVKNGKVVKVVQGATHVARPDYRLADEEIIKGDHGSIIVQPTNPRAA